MEEFLNRQSTRPILVGMMTSHLKNGSEHRSGLRKTSSYVKECESQLAGLDSQQSAR